MMKEKGCLIIQGSESGIRRSLDGDFTGKGITEWEEEKSTQEAIDDLNYSEQTI